MIVKETMPEETFVAALMYNLYKKPLDAVHGELSDIIWKNKKLMKTDQNMVFFDGQLYSLFQMSGEKLPKPLPALHNSLYKKMREYVRKKSAIRDYTYLCIESAWIAVLKLTQNPTDLRELLPNTLKHICDFPNEYYDRPRWDKQTKDEFLAKNGKYINMVKELKLSELLDSATF
jgi:hypothetical protein